MTTPLAPIAEPTLGQPGWNAAFRALLDRVNDMDERIIDVMATALVAGTGLTLSHNDAANTITLSQAGGAAALDTEALMDYLSGSLVPGTDLELVYDDAAGTITLNYTGGAPVTPTIDPIGQTGNPTPSLHDMVAWTLDPANAGSSSAPSAGDLNLLKINVPYDVTVASLLLQIATAGSGLSNCYMALFDMLGNRLGLSADQSTAFQSSGSKVVPFASPVALTKGEYYVGKLIGSGSTTPPAISRGAASNVTNLGLSAGGFRTCLAGTALTAIPATVALASTTAPSNAVAWCVGLRAA